MSKRTEVFLSEVGGEWRVAGYEGDGEAMHAVRDGLDMLYGGNNDVVAAERAYTDMREMMESWRRVATQLRGAMRDTYIDRASEMFDADVDKILRPSDCTRLKNFNPIPF